MTRPAALAVIALLSLSARADVAPAKPTGKGIFLSTCAACHGADGRGQTDYGKQHSIPDFTSKAWSAKQTDPALIATVTDGELEAEMPAFGKQLRPDEIRLVVAYIRGLAKK